jgi:hypothetical protein
MGGRGDIDIDIVFWTIVLTIDVGKLHWYLNTATLCLCWNFRSPILMLERFFSTLMLECFFKHYSATIPQQTYDNEIRWHQLLLSNTCVFLVTQTSIIKYMCISCYSNFYYQIHVYFLLLKLLLQIHVYFLLLKLLLQIHVYFLLNDQHWIQHKLTTRMKPYTYLYNRYCLPLWI